MRMKMMISLKNSAELVKHCSKDVCKSYYTIAENSAAFLPPSPEFDGTANVKQADIAAEVDAEEQVQEEQYRRKEHRTHNSHTTAAAVINHSLRLIFCAELASYMILLSLR